MQAYHEDLPSGEDPEDDEIMAELHQIRREILAEFDGDRDAYYRHLREIEENERRRGRVVVDFSQGRRPRPEAA
jgi:hypothetical protein